MFEDIQLICMNVKILKFWGLIYTSNWRRYFCCFLATILVFTQFYYMFMTNEGIDAIILNSYMLVLWFNTILRAFILIKDNGKYQKLIADLELHFYDMQKTNDLHIKSLLQDVNYQGIVMARGNLFLGLFTCVGFVLYPLFATGRALPFGSMIPGIDEYSSPFYEFWYVYQSVVTPMGCCMYIPYTSLIVSFIMFGIVMSKVLQYRLRSLKCYDGEAKIIREKVIECIKYQNAIIEYIDTVNRLTTYIFLLEFIAFGTLLCALLFLLIFVDSLAQLIIVCGYITMIFAQIFALYWYANELQEQNLSVAAAAYETEWFTFELPVQKYILLLILRAQKPCSIKVGSIHPMTLELFQALLNASYSYFTLLKRVYAKDNY